MELSSLCFFLFCAHFSVFSVASLLIFNTSSRFFFLFLPPFLVFLLFHMSTHTHIHSCTLGSSDTSYVFLSRKLWPHEYVRSPPLLFVCVCVFFIDGVNVCVLGSHRSVVVSLFPARGPLRLRPQLRTVSVSRLGGHAKQLPPSFSKAAGGAASLLLSAPQITSNTSIVEDMRLQAAVMWCCTGASHFSVCCFHWFMAYRLEKSVTP